MTREWMVSSSAMILLVVFIRWRFRKKMQPCIRYALWLAVAFRLMIPVSFLSTAVSILNLLPENARTEGSLTENRSGTEAGEGSEREAEEDSGYEAEGDFWQEAGAASWQAAGSDGRENGGNGKQPEKQASDKSMIQEQEEKSVSEGAVRGKGNGRDTGRLVRFIWLIGVVLCSMVFMTVNAEYKRRLKRSRRRIEESKLPEKSRVPVYVANMAETPCLFGLFHPAVYMTEKAVSEEKTFAFVLFHENMHYRQRDNWWVLVRNLCLCLHWFNPLVWLAASLSRQDCELSCDEKVLRELGSEARKDYGEILLELSTAPISGIKGWRISTTMSGSKRHLSERLQMIVNAPGKSVRVRFQLLVLMALVLAVTFTGRTGRSLAAGIKERDGSNGEPDELAVNGGEPEEIREPGEGPEGIREPGQEPEEIREPGEEREETATSGEDWDSMTVSDNNLEETEVSGRESKERNLSVGGNGNLQIDLNFDGWDDLCVPRQEKNGKNVLYDCLIWNQQTRQFEPGAAIYNVDTDMENQWITSTLEGEKGSYSVTYYRYDDRNQLHMIRYVEENPAFGAVFEHLDLTYVEDGSMYTLPAVADETDFHHTLVDMAKQALGELYQWTGQKVDKACFQVSNMGSVLFGVSEEDIRHSRIFFSRSFGADTEYNISDYEKMISCMDVASGRSVWYSPVLWRQFPEKMDKMTNEEIITWYVEQVPLAQKPCTVKSIEKRYQDMWTVETGAGTWFEVVYNTKLREISSVTGPYLEKPVH